MHFFSLLMVLQCIMLLSTTYSYQSVLHLRNTQQSWPVRTVRTGYPLRKRVQYVYVITPFGVVLLVYPPDG